MSSKDLNGLALLPKIIELGIDSLKVEGRMKSELYVATVGRSYRKALDSYGVVAASSPWEQELEKIPHREYCSGNLLKPADASSILFDKEREIDEYCVVGSIIEVIPEIHLLLEVKNSFLLGETLEFLSPSFATGQTLLISKIETVIGENLSKSKPNTLVKLPYIPGVAVNDLVRKRVL